MDTFDDLFLIKLCFMYNSSNIFINYESRSLNVSIINIDIVIINK